MSLGELERELINRYQGGFPLQAAPFGSLAEDLGCTEDTLLGTIEQLLEAGVLSRFGPLYDAVRLGGGLTLAALSVPEDQYERITAVVNEYAEVAHNYRREHELNMWFVLATASPEAIDSTLGAIEQATGLKVYNFPKQHEFYIGLWLQLDAEGQVRTIPVPGGVTGATTPVTNGAATDTSSLPDELDRTIIGATQAGIPLTNEPYQAIADSAGCTADEVIQRLQNMLATGVIRRIGAVPNHYRLGLKANGMTVWDVSDDDAIALGEKIGQLDFVSHCYLRPRHLPVWRYNLFAMVHGHTRDEVDTKAGMIADMLGNNCKAHEVLFSSAILKKTGMRLAA
ncbi:MAG: hypothetical protein JSW45_12835 [Thiotrichales bacterium]|nr:MAG: hypothetical protein JSW45_12835 [Thiotrichales bacterium]